MNKEKIFLDIINKTISDNSYLGDDCAYLKELGLLVSMDSLVEDVHFKTSYYTPYELGKKAVLVNISDILAGGGVPLYILISLSGKLNEDFIKEFYKGANAICDNYNVKIIGGDLVGGDKISISIVILGNGFNRNLSSLKNVKTGDNVYIKGFHGNSAKGLELLLKGEKDKNNKFIKAHLEPKLFPETSFYISENVKTKYAMTDTSDGIYYALKRISEESNVGFNIDFNLIPKEIEDKKLVLFGGEDFGLLICLDKKEDYIAQYLDLTKIGTVEEGKEIKILNYENFEDLTFEHFKN